MKELDKNKAYDLRGLSKEQRVELLEWLTKNDKGWGKYNINILKECVILGFADNFNQWVFDSIDKEIIDATTLFNANNLEDLGFKPIGDGFYSINLGKVVISIRKNVYIEEGDDIVELFEYDFEKVKKLVEVWK